MTLHFMSDKELSRLEMLRDFTSGRLTTSAADKLLGLERRQVQRLALVASSRQPMQWFSSTKSVRFPAAGQSLHPTLSGTCGRPLSEAAARRLTSKNGH